MKKLFSVLVFILLLAACKNPSDPTTIEGTVRIYQVQPAEKHEDRGVFARQFTFCSGLILLLMGSVYLLFTNKQKILKVRLAPPADFNSVSLQPVKAKSKNLRLRSANQKKVFERFISAVEKTQRFKLSEKVSIDLIAAEFHRSNPDWFIPRKRLLKIAINLGYQILGEKGCEKIAGKAML